MSSPRKPTPFLRSHLAWVLGAFNLLVLLSILETTCSRRWPTMRSACC